MSRLVQLSPRCLLVTIALYRPDHCHSDFFQKVSLSFRTRAGGHYIIHMSGWPGNRDLRPLQTNLKGAFVGLSVLNMVVCFFVFNCDFAFIFVQGVEVNVYSGGKVTMAAGHEVASVH